MSNDMVVLKQLLDYPILEERLYTSKGQASDSKALIHGKTGRIMSVVSMDYKTLSNSVAILPMLEDLLNGGWKVAPAQGPRGNVRRSPVRVEKEGALVFIEMFHPDASFTMPSRKVQTGTGKVFAAGMFSTSHDATRAYRFRGGLMEEWCTNGAVRPVKGHGVQSSIRHIGDAQDKAGYLQELAATFLSNLGSIQGEWNALAESKPALDRRYSALRLVSEGKGEKADEYSARQAFHQHNEGYTGWETYQTVTSALTHTPRYTKLGTLTHEAKNRQAIEYLNGTLPAEKMPDFG